MMRSQSASSSSLSAGLIRASTCSRSLSASAFFETERDRLPLMVASADLMRSDDTSLSSTSKPAWATTWAMPLPICPAPITPTFRMLIAIFDSHRWA